MAADPTTKLCVVSVVLLLALVSSLQVSFRWILLYILLLLVLCNQERFKLCVFMSESGSFSRQSYQTETELQDTSGFVWILFTF